MKDGRWVVSPEVSGELGERTEMDTSVHPPKVTRLHHRLEGWLGDDLLECFPCFLVTSTLANALSDSRLSGFDLREIEVTASPEFEDMYPGRALPELRWLKIAGAAPGADFRLTEDFRLDVSDSALALLRKFRINNAVVKAA